MGIHIDVDTSTFAAALAAKRAELQKAISDGVAMGGQIICDEAKAEAPVDTGALRASIATRHSGNVCEVGTNIEYAPYQEYGTYKMKAQPFLIPAMYGKKDEVVQEILDRIKNI